MFSYDITKHEVIAAVQQAFPMSYTDGSWSAPAHPHEVPSLDDGDLYFWRVPTSMFFGMRPVKMGDKAVYDPVKQEKKMTYQVHNKRADF